MNIYPEEFEFDVALSFAGEDRASARDIATLLRSAGLAVFYDEYFKSQLWGKDLYQHLSEVYGKRARYCIILVSEAYASKLWTKHELRSAQERWFQQTESEYLLPIRLDDTEVPGLPETVGYLDLRHMSIQDAATLFLEKVGLGSTDALDKHFQLVKVTPDLELRWDEDASSFQYSWLCTAIKLRDPNGKIAHELGEGESPLDSTINAIDKAVKTLIGFEFSMRPKYVRLAVVPDRTIAQGRISVLVSVEHDARRVVAQSIGLDVASAAAHAYLSCINQCFSSTHVEPP